MFLRVSEPVKAVLHCYSSELGLGSTSGSSWQLWLCPPRPELGWDLPGRDGGMPPQPVGGVPATLCPHPALPRDPGDGDGRICPLQNSCVLHVPQLRSHTPAVQADVFPSSQGAFPAAQEGPWGPWSVPTVTEPGAHSVSSTALAPGREGDVPTREL